jgi:GST-like protein
MPALVDHEPEGGGDPVGVFESGAIMIYLAEKYRRFIPADLRGRYETIQWVIWQMANQGPKTGENGHFKRASADPKNGDLAYAVRRFGDEVHRLYGVLNNRLWDRSYVAGADYTIADMICYPWTAGWKLQGIDIDEFPHFKRWHEDMAAKPAVQKGMAVMPNGPAEDPASLTAEERERRSKLLYNQRAIPSPA